MALYSVKKSRGRKIKKYRKSRRGKGRGKINLKCGKTRRYKVFKNTKNNTLGKRKGKGRGRGRRMMGGVLKSFYFVIDAERIMNYINVKYKDKFIENGIPETGFTSVEFKMDIQTMITNRSKGLFLRKENKRQRILIYACLVDTKPMCYALVRVPQGDLNAINDPGLRYSPNSNQPILLTDAEKSKIPIDGMDAKILFIFPSKRNFTSVDITDSTTKDKDITAAVKDSMQVLNNYMEKLQKKQFTEDEYRKNFKLREFQSFISSNGDKYRIFLSPNMCIQLDNLLSLPTISEEDPQYAVSSDAVSSDDAPYNAASN